MAEKCTPRRRAAQTERAEWLTGAGRETDCLFNEAESDPGGERLIFARWRRVWRSFSGSVITAWIRIGVEQRDLLGRFSREAYDRTTEMSASPMRAVKPALDACWQL